MYLRPTIGRLAREEKNYFFGDDLVNNLLKFLRMAVSVKLLLHKAEA